MSVRLDGLRARRIAAGLTVTELARKSNTSDLLINELESVGTTGWGGACTEADAVRILDAIAPPQAFVAATQANPTYVIPTVSVYFRNGDTVVLSGVLGADPDLNGTYVISNLSGLSFSIDLDTSGGFPGSGGSIRLDGASVGLSRL